MGNTMMYCIPVFFLSMALARHRKSRESGIYAVLYLLLIHVKMLWILKESSFVPL